MSPVTAALVIAGSLLLLSLLAKLFVEGTAWWPVRKSRSDVVATLNAAAESRLTYGEWDHFVSMVIRDPELDRVREICWNELFKEYTPTEDDDEHGMFSNAVDQERIRQLIRSLENAPETSRSR